MFVTIIVGVAALLVGLIIGFVVANSSRSKLIAQNTSLEVQLAGLEAQKASLAEQLSSQAEAFGKQIAEERAMADKRLQEEKSAAMERMMAQKESQDALYAELLSKTKEEIKNLTDELLKQRQKEFSESSALDLGRIINPLRENMEEMKQKMAETTRQQTAMSSEMKVNLENMLRQSASAQKTTEELTRAFKHESKVQGDWGEIVLQELLESQGLRAGEHFDVQPVMRDDAGNVIHGDDGRTFRPDVIFHVDETRELIIDSKVSLSAYFSYVNEENPAQKAVYLKAHVSSLKEHVRELSNKGYEQYLSPKKISTDYVLMFVPHAAALWTALNEEPSLWRDAMNKHVFIVGEQNLYATLKIISMMLKQIRQEESQKLIFEEVDRMIHRVGLFIGHFDKIGKALKTAQKEFDDAEKNLSEKGQTSILIPCRRLQKMGAKPAADHLQGRLNSLDDDSPNYELIEDNNHETE